MTQMKSALIALTFLIFISGCGFTGNTTDNDEYYQKTGYNSIMVQKDLDKCGNEISKITDSDKKSYTIYAKRAFCMRDKGYTTKLGPITDPNCSYYKQETGKVLPICAAHGVY